jgi:CPA2 family monovalent cation:H+ antiporter-2
MEGHVETGAYKDVVLFLATAGVVVPLFRRWKISPILGFLMAGVLLGPYGLAPLARDFEWLSAITIDNPGELSQLAELGVVFLLFTIGLELSWERLRAMRRLVFGLGALQVGVCITAAGAVALFVGQPLVAALAIGAALALSSTAIVMPILAEQKRQHSQAGRATFSVLLFQDLAVAPILVTLTLLGRGDSGESLGQRLLFSLGPSVLGVVVLLVMGRLLLRPMLRSVAKAKSEELFLAACLLVVIGAGLVSALTGLSMALGAFIAGLLLAETEFRHEVETRVEPFKGLLLGLFFISVGLQLNVPLLLDRPFVILGAATAMIVFNTAVVFGLARLFGLKTRSALEAALLLAGAGEFAFVILGQAMAGGLVNPLVGQTTLVAATVSMFCIPLLAMLSLRLGGRRLVPSELPPDVGGDPDLDGRPPPQVLVVGYGRVGRLVGEMLRRHGIPWVAAELDPRLVEQGRRAGDSIYFGDASRPEFLTRCGLGDAPAVVVTMDNPEGVESIVAVVRGLRPDLTIVARARDARHAQRLYDLGATDAVPETVEASLQLSEAVLVEIGVPMGLVIASIHERRDEFRTALNRPDAMGGRTRRFRRDQG